MKLNKFRKLVFLKIVYSDDMISIINNSITKIIEKSNVFDEFLIHKFDTPIGEMVIGSIINHICLLEFCDTNRHNNEISELEKAVSLKVIYGNNDIISQAKYQLEQYFTGKLTNFDLPLLTVGTPFQISVWNSLLKIPYSTKISYQEQAEILDSPNSVRAVANANGKNKISIIIPCHRVIGKNGNMRGYGGGIHRKEWLINLEHNYHS